MPLLKTPVCDFGRKAESFKLKSVNSELISLNDIKGERATLIMFICNHCPYVKAIIKDLVKDCNEFRKKGINSIAIMSNDTKNYPEDSFENMITFAKTNSFGELNYLIDENQEIAKKFRAVCTPDFFGYNKNFELQYRGRFNELKNLKPVNSKDSDLKLAMNKIADTQEGPKKQIPSMGCSIKWFN
ncbi:thioredoxin family protein [Pelagibacteraceae bacterium]|nr:thioredoxin family protein [Pelagibacteraceae bacterium]